MDDLLVWLRAQLAEDERDWLPTATGARQNGKTTARRMLAEVDAKRRILELYDVSTSRELKPDAWELMKHAVRALALPYADRPGYRDEWRP
ncbi:DUF6221 family protein [Micromonospora sp. DT44]|uniref:DUF6221 family protein n=1 Tax=Micromonospora sp. DT44 TaxID=3393439 RepID=UPI003CF1073A